MHGTYKIHACMHVTDIGRRMPVFLKLLLSATSVCVRACVCMCVKLHSRDI